MPTIRPSIATPTANCYVTEASANSYFEERYNSQAWDNLASSTNATAASNIKKSLLIQSTRELDRTYRFFGSKYNYGVRGQSNYQNLQFPRQSDYDADSNLYIQDDVKYATYEQALWILMRTNQRRTEEGTIVNTDMVSKEAYDYIRPYVTRQVVNSGQYPWQ